MGRSGVTNAINIALVAAVAVLAVGFVLVASSSRSVNVNMSSPEIQQNVITITGSASVKVVPDEARLQVGVVTRGQTASEAMWANSETASRVFSELRALGLSEREIQTTSISVNPEYDCSSGECVLKGYVATNMMEITLRGGLISKAGEAIDRAVEAGSNLLYGIYFSVSKERSSQLGQEVLKAAVSDARSKAELLARELGLRIVGVASVSINFSPETMRVPISAFEATDGAVRSTPISPGEQTVWAQVTVSFKIE
ncbi:MAG: SIMPL domain-containing protein [Thaumarchaeota archaeon]|nr:SIMPL domain-containing protein [Candidatus Calditenuaceae archaeon]MDW8187557.1 SIMPL domain-containing protein [Nitrososphaerota archaeon]